MKISLQEAFQALQVNQSTLYRWLEKANITPEPDSVDTRKKLLTIEQLQALAEAHNIILPMKYRGYAYEMHSKPEPPIVTEDVSRWRTEIDELKVRIERLEKLVECLQSEKQEQPAIVTDNATRLEKRQPDEPVTLSDFAELHTIPVRTARDHAKSIGAIKGPGGMWYLDTQSKATFFQQFHDHLRFHRCDQCPHDPD
jgi:hypothetical protein